ncbi:hypothetical protein A2U01_0093739, partial [Trifolium medium]|nr:hypothetical protein [Trifolium medium]
PEESETQNSGDARDDGELEDFELVVSEELGGLACYKVEIMVGILW